MANFFIPENKGTDPTGRFLDRNTNAGIFGAVIYAMILNQLGDESEALVKAAGFTPSSEDTTQWLQAIRKLYGDADTALKEELISKIEALTASDIAFDDSISISASNVQEAITALDTLIKTLQAENIAFDDSISLGASNLQELGSKLNEKFEGEIKKLQSQIDTLTNSTIIADGEEHLTGQYYENADGGRKPIYYRYLDLRSYSAYTQDFNTSSNEWNIDLICNDNMGYDIRGNGSYFYQFNSRGDFVNNVIRDVHIYFDSKTKRFGLYIEQYSGTTHRAGLFKIKYTKTTDSYEY